MPNQLSTSGDSPLVIEGCCPLAVIQPLPNVWTALQCAIRQGSDSWCESCGYARRRKLAGNNDAVRSDAHVVPGTGGQTLFWG